MTAVVATFICQAKIGFGLDMNISIMIGIAAAVAAFGAFFVKYVRPKAAVEAN
ncbi:hypothetical protein [Maridesulfovibrio sp.]